MFTWTGRHGPEALLECRLLKEKLYPGHMLENTWKNFELNPYIPVTKQTSPTFLLQAEDDPIDTVKNSLVYYAVLNHWSV